MRFLGDRGVVVQGQHSGLTYLFGGGSTLEVDERDVAALVATGYFARSA